MNESYKTLLTFSVSDMVCYNSMSPLPSLASILCFSSSSFSFYALLFFLLRSTHLLFNFSSTFYTMCCLCILFVAPQTSPLDYALCLILPTCITLRETLFLFSILHVFHMSSHLPDHHAKYSSSMVAIQGFLVSLAVILRTILFSVSRNYSSSLAAIARQFLASLGSKSLPSCDLWW
jgi:hypothetical protein